jgi:hypothetical protein
MTDHTRYAIAMSDRELICEIRITRKKCVFGWSNDIRGAMVFDRTLADAFCSMINVKMPRVRHYVVEAP